MVSNWNFGRVIWFLYRKKNLVEGHGLLQLETQFSTKLQCILSSFLTTSLIPFFIVIVFFYAASALLEYAIANITYSIKIMETDDGANGVSNIKLFPFSFPFFFSKNWKMCLFVEKEAVFFHWKENKKYIKIITKLNLNFEQLY